MFSLKLILLFCGFGKKANFYLVPIYRFDEYDPLDFYYSMLLFYYYYYCFHCNKISLTCVSFSRVKPLNVAKLYLEVIHIFLTLDITRKDISFYKFIPLLPPPPFLLKKSQLHDVTFNFYLFSPKHPSAMFEWVLYWLMFTWSTILTTKSFTADTVSTFMKV